jgi:3-hydroxybutyryl-CoA dehydrogenase
MGPFGILDKIGMQTAYNVSMLWEQNWEIKRLDRAAIIKSDFIDKGKMG